MGFTFFLFIIFDSKKKVFLMLQNKTENSNFGPKFACYFVIKEYRLSSTSLYIISCWYCATNSSCVGIGGTPPRFQALLQGVKLSCIVLVKKINKNPKIRIKLIYFYFEFSNKLFSMRIFIFLVFFFAFFYALKSVFNGDFIFSNFSFTKK